MKIQTILYILTLILCSCQSAPQNSILKKDIVTNNLTKKVSNTLTSSNKSTADEYELYDDSSSFCEIVQEKDDCLEE